MPSLRSLNNEIKIKNILLKQIQNTPNKKRTYFQRLELARLKNEKNNLNFKRHMFTNLNKISKQNIINKKRKLWNRQTVTNLYNFLGKFKNENVPKNYESPISLSHPTTNLVYRTVNNSSGRENWFTPGEIRRLARTLNNYEIFTSNNNTVLFKNPTTRANTRRKNLTLARRV